MRLRQFALPLTALLLGICFSGAALAGRGGHSGHGGHFSGGGHFPGHGHFAGGGHFAGHGHFSPVHGRGHARFGVFIGGPFWGGPFWPGYYPGPYYYPPAVVTVPVAPPTYIEQGDGGAAPGEAYWYYCAESKTYYPYVKKCPGGWQRVPVQPAEE